jgi:hypothetical protein
MLRNLSSFTIPDFPQFNAMPLAKLRKATLVQELSCMSLTIMSISSASIFIVRSFGPLRHGIVPDRRNNALFYGMASNGKNWVHFM